LYGSALRLKSCVPLGALGIISFLLFIKC